MAIRASYDWHSATWQPHFGSDLAVSFMVLCSWVAAIVHCSTSSVLNVSCVFSLSTTHSVRKVHSKFKNAYFSLLCFSSMENFLCASCQVLEMLARETLRFSLYLMLFIVLFGAVRITKKAPSRFITSEKRWAKSANLSTTCTLHSRSKIKLRWKILSVDSAVIAPKYSSVSIRIIWRAEQANKRFPSTSSVFLKAFKDVRLNYHL